MAKVLVIGASLSGEAVSRYLNARGYEVILTDIKAVKKKEELEKAGIKVYDGGHPDFLKTTDYDFVVKNPGIPYTGDFVRFFVENGLKIYNEIEIALRDHPQVSYGAITGTNGKTTTTTMLGEMLKTLDPNNQACGNIGVPLCDILTDEKPRKLAIEIAAFQLLGCETFHPQVSVIMNLTPDHVDYFGTLDAYYKAKTLVYKNQGPKDYFIRNIDDENVLKYCTDIPCRVIDLSLEREADLCVRNGKGYYKNHVLFELNRFRLVGMHNVQNALVAGCMAYLMGVKLKDIRNFMHEFRGVEHRIEFVREFNGVTYYNDSKGTNVDSTVMALKAFSKPVHLLAGGYDKKTGFEGLRPYMDHVKTVYAYGTTKDQFVPLHPDVRLYDNMEQALRAACENAQAGEVVLLSPACASWDQFPNYEVRGKIFKEIVSSLH